jgi:hypothetical protein
MTALELRGSLPLAEDGTLDMPSMSSMKEWARVKGAVTERG